MVELAVAEGQGGGVGLHEMRARIVVTRNPVHSGHRERGVAERGEPSAATADVDGGLAGAAALGAASNSATRSVARSQRIAVGEPRADPAARGGIGRGSVTASILRHVAESEVPDNLLDRVSDPDTLELHYAQVKRRERALLGRLLPLEGRRRAVGRSGLARRTAPLSRAGVEADRGGLDLNAVRHATQTAQADEALVASAGESCRSSPESFDVVLYRLVLHHVAYKRPLGPVISEATGAFLTRLQVGYLVEVEPGLFHPVGAALALANRIGVAERVHGTVDDLPLSR